MVDFLRLNGLPVPVADSGSTALDRMGFEEADRMFDGSISRRRTTEKRTWKFTTPPLTASAAQILEAVLQGRGEGWSFDADAWSARPLAPNTAANTFTGYRLSGPADGRAGFLDYNPTAYGKGIELGEVTTNLLVANQRSVETDTSGFVALDAATLAQSPDYFYHGTKSLRVVTSATVNGVRGGVYTSGVATTSAATHSGSVYLFATSAITLRGFIRNASTATDGPIVTITLAPYEWKRLRCVSPVLASGHVLQLRIEEGTADSGIEFFADALQIEAGAVASPFVDGARAVGAQAVYQGLNLHPFRDLTLSFWTPAEFSSGTRYAVTLRQSAISGYYITIGAIGASLYLVVNGPQGSWSSAFPTVFSAWAGKWIQVTYETATQRIRVLVNGVQITSTIATAWAPLSSLSWVHLGALGGSNHWLYPIDDFVILPWLASDTHLANIRAATRSLAIAPRLWAEGSFLPEGGGILCDAQLADSAFASYAGVTNARRVSFALEEV